MKRFKKKYKMETQKKVHELLNYTNDIANLLGVDDKEVVTALSDFFDNEEFSELFELALNQV